MHTNNPASDKLAGLIAFQGLDNRGYSLWAVYLIYKPQAVL